MKNMDKYKGLTVYDLHEKEGLSVSRAKDLHQELYPSLYSLGLSVKIVGGLVKNGIYNVDALTSKKPIDLIRMRSVGRPSVKVIQEKLVDAGLSLTTPKVGDYGNHPDRLLK